MSCVTRRGRSVAARFIIQHVVLPNRRSCRDGVGVTSVNDASVAAVLLLSLSLILGHLLNNVTRILQSVRMVIHQVACEVTGLASSSASTIQTSNNRL